MHNALPTKFFRWRMALASLDICSKCYEEEESQLHCLRDCVKVREVWHLVGTYEECLGFQHIALWLHHLTSSVNCPFYCATLWWIWRARNDEVLGQKIISRDVILRNIWFEANLLIPTPQNHVPAAWLIWWQWPNEVVFKLNVDGSSFGNPGKAGFWGLDRGADGCWIFGFCDSVGFADNLLPELMAICYGLRLA